MIDFHSHILPYTDDGAKNFDMSLDMLRISEAEGVKYICATSHFIPGEIELSKQHYTTKLDNVRQLAKLKDIKVQIVPALELYMSPDLPRLYKEKQIWGINDTRYLLFEFPMQQIPMYAEEVLYELRLEGAVPVIAHPERNFAIIKNEKLLEDLVNQGALAQVNAGSLRGIYGKDIKAFAEHLVTRNLVHLLGSDGHNDRERSTTMLKGREAIKELNPELYDWMAQAQYKVINGEEVILPEVKAAKKRFDFTKMFR
jgi:protein-tyrosine phosphatase